MKNKLKQIWDDKGNYVMTCIAVVATTVAVLAISGNRDLNKFLDEKGLSDEYYELDKDLE